MFYIIVNNKDLDIYKDEIILPLKDYSIGFDTYFSLEEIKEISLKRKVNVIINRFMHKDDLINIKPILEELSGVVNLFFIEDLGLTNIIDNNKVVLYQSHIANNYNAINAFEKIGINSVVLNNDLTIDEIKEIRDNTNSNIFIISTAKTSLMYSRRMLLSSYYEHTKTSGEKVKEIKEVVTKKPLIIKEEDKGTVIFNDRITSLNKYLNELNDINFIVNLSNMSNEEKDIILNHYKDTNLSDYIEIDDYFFNNKIIYKVGER